MLSNESKKIIKEICDRNIMNEETGSNSALSDGLKPPVPKWVADEIKETWFAARQVNGQLEAFRIIERMVDRLGYGRTENNPKAF